MLNVPRFGVQPQNIVDLASFPEGMLRSHDAREHRVTSEWLRRSTRVRSQGICSISRRHAEVTRIYRTLYFMKKLLARSRNPQNPSVFSAFLQGNPVFGGFHFRNPNLPYMIHGSWGFELCIFCNDFVTFWYNTKNYKKNTKILRSDLDFRRFKNPKFLEFKFEFRRDRWPSRSEHFWSGRFSFGSKTQNHQKVWVTSFSVRIGFKTQNRF